MRPAWLLLALVELKLLARSPLNAANAVLAPMAMGIGWVLLEREAGTGGSGAVAAFQVLLLIGFVPYVAATTTLAARRQEHVLKRLRTSAASDAAIVVGMLLPLAALVVVQTVVLLATTVALGGSSPAVLWPLVLAVVGGTVMAAALAFVTATVTSGPEMAQFTTLPVFIALFGGGMWAAGTAPADMSWQMLAVPGVAAAHLVRLGWEGTDVRVATVLPSCVALVALSVVAVALARRFFRWDPRS